MKLVVGLGNPGKEYEKTRHNIGFMCLDNYLGDVKWSTKFNGLYYETSIKGEKYIFVKPQSYMNLSGGVVRQYKDYFDIDIEDILVIQDDLDLPVGKIRLKINSSAGGHNGIKSIINQLGTNKFLRLKIGLAKEHEVNTIDYVLGKLTKKELLQVDNDMEHYFKVINTFIDGGIEKVQKM